MRVSNKMVPPQGAEQVLQHYAAVETKIEALKLKSALSTAELNRRPSRPPDYAAENRALISLAHEMAASPAGILQALADTALTLCRAHSAGLSLLEKNDQKKNFTGAQSPVNGLLT
jgi:hypothetical protein